MSKATHFNTKTGEGYFSMTNTYTITAEIIILQICALGYSSKKMTKKYVETHIKTNLAYEGSYFFSKLRTEFVEEVEEGDYNENYYAVATKIAKKLYPDMFKNYLKEYNLTK